LDKDNPTTTSNPIAPERTSKRLKKNPSYWRESQGYPVVLGKVDPKESKNQSSSESEWTPKHMESCSSDSSTKVPKKTNVKTRARTTKRKKKQVVLRQKHIRRTDRKRVLDTGSVPSTENPSSEESGWQPSNEQASPSSTDLSNSSSRKLECESPKEDAPARNLRRRGSSKQSLSEVSPAENPSSEESEWISSKDERSKCKKNKDESSKQDESSHHIDNEMGIGARLRKARTERTSSTESENSLEQDLTEFNEHNADADLTKCDYTVRAGDVIQFKKPGEPNIVYETVVTKVNYGSKKGNLLIDGHSGLHMYSRIRLIQRWTNGKFISVKSEERRLNTWKFVNGKMDKEIWKVRKSSQQREEEREMISRAIKKLNEESNSSEDSYESDSSSYGKPAKRVLRSRTKETPDIKGSRPSKKIINRGRNVRIPTEVYIRQCVDEGGKRLEGGDDHPKKSWRIHDYERTYRFYACQKKEGKNFYIRECVGYPICKSDVITLAPGQYVNDIIVNAYMQFIMESETTVEGCEFMTSHLTQKLAGKDHLFQDDMEDLCNWANSRFRKYKERMDERNNQGNKPGPKRKGRRKVIRKKKTREYEEKGIFGLRKLFFPVCENSHWILVMADFEKKTVSSLDSLSGHGDSSMGRKWRMKVLEFLTVVHLKMFEEFLSTDWKMNGVNNAPKQTNGYDCGLFVLYNAETLASGRKVEYPAYAVEDQMRVKVTKTLFSQDQKLVEWNY